MIALLAEVGIFDGLDGYDVAWVALAISAVAAAVGVLHRWVWLPGCARMRRYDAAVELIIGYGPVLDPATGRELQPAMPPLAVRFSSMESAVATLATAEANRSQADLEREHTTSLLATIAERQQEHEQWAERVHADGESWKRSHIEDVERVHAAMWSAINALQTGAS